MNKRENTRRGYTQDIVVKRLSLLLANGGFTLLEILVVVLIIGILGAIALPQYQRASLKSRFAALMPIGKSLADSNEAYYLEHGEYALDPQELPVQGRSNYAGGTAINLVDGQDLSYVQVSNAQVPNAQYIVYQKHSNRLSGATVCEAADERADELCLALGGTETSLATGANWTAYLLSGTNSSVPGTCKVGTGTFQEGQAVGNRGVTCKTVCEDGDCETKLSGGKTYDTSQCYTTSAYGCAGSTFTSGERCMGIASNGCANSTFIGWRSHCGGHGVNACTGSIVLGNGYCLTTQVGACDGVKYGTDPTGQIPGMGTCSEEGLGSCPDGVPLQGRWNGHTFDITGWKGGYCDATAMVSGECPAGSPTGSATVTTDKTTADGWYGGYCNPSVSGTCPSGSPKQGGGCWDGDGGTKACS